MNPAAAGPDAARAAHAYVALLEALVTALRGGTVGGTRAARAIVTGLEVPTMNGVVVVDDAASAHEIEDALGEVAGWGLPHCVQARPAVRDVAASVATSWGMQATEEPIPLMAVSGPVRSPELPGLGIRRAVSVAEHSALAARAFGAPEDIFARVTEATLELAGARVWIAERAGEPVSTCLSIVGADTVAIFDVATPPEHRARGYGGAITAAAVNAGLADGASWAWLQSSEAGFSVYRRLGFVTLEAWDCWTAV